MSEVRLHNERGDIVYCVLVPSPVCFSVDFPLLYLPTVSRLSVAPVPLRTEEPNV